MLMPNIARTASLTHQLQIKINGVSLQSEARSDLISTTVIEDVDVLGMFTLELVARNLRGGEFTWVDDNLFDIGNEVEISMGNGTEMSRLMIGTITGLEPEFERNEVPTLIVRGHDLRHRLMRGQKTRSFTNTTDAKIFCAIAEKAGLKAIVKDTNVQLEYVLQHNQTDLDFLQSRAQRIGYEVAIDGKTLAFRPQNHNRGHFLTLDRNDLLSFSPRISIMNQAGGVEVRGWDLNEKQATVSEATRVESTMGGRISGPQESTKFGNFSRVIVTEPFSSRSDSEQVARGQLETSALTYITGTGECRGHGGLRAGRVIKITGVGKRFSGLYYVISASHTYGRNEGYRTEFEVRRNAK